MKKVFSKSLSLLLSVFTIFGLFGSMPIFVNAVDSKLENAIQWAVNIANDNSHGYSQKNRWGPDYDCSSFVISALKSGGISTGSASTTADMVSQLTKNGFSYISWSNTGGVSGLQRGDILWRNGHTEMYIGNNQQVGAHRDHGHPETGDPSGKEVSVTSFYYDSWEGILRYNSNDITSVPQANPTPVVQPSTQTCSCSESSAGEYEVTTSSKPLTIRAGHGTNYSSLGSIPKGTHVYVTKADGTWAHVNYNNISGYVYMSYLTKVATQPVPVPAPPANPTITDDSNIVANVESVTGGTNTITVTGWIFDRDDTSQTIAVDIYVGGVVGTSEAEGHRIFANINRSDVNNVHKCGNNHGFSATFVTNKTGNQPVYLYGINVGNGSINPCIGTSSVYINDPPKDVGTAFYAYIKNPFSGLAVGQTNDNVVIQTKTDTAEQQWYFVRQDDCSYEIKNPKTGKCLEVAEAGTGNGSNVRIWPDNDTAAQRWYIVGTPDRYSLVPKYAAGMAMDVFGGGIGTNGTNIQLWEKNNTKAQIFSLQVFNADTESPVVSNIAVNKISSKGYRVTCYVSDNVGITEVLFPTWTDNNGQDDIIYYKGTVSGNTATIYIPTSKHNNEKGTYITHIYAYDQAGNAGFGGYGIVLRDDNEPYFAKSTEYNGHIYTMYLADMSWTEAQTWCEKQGGYLATVTSQEEWDTIKWLVTHKNAPCCWLGAENTSGSWKWVTGENFTYSDWLTGEPNCEDGKEFYLGTFGNNYVNAYQWNDFPDLTEYVGCFVMEEPLDKISPTVTNPTVSKVSGKGYQVTCNIEDNFGVTKVLFPTWTDKNEQDDVIYYEGTISGNTATVYIPTTEHNNETGLYHTHIYAYDAEGNSGFAGTACNIIDDEPYEMKSTEYNGHTYTMYLADMSWTEAQTWCEKQGGYLATVTSQEEWNTIKWLVTHNNAPCCWLGAESTSGSWKWVTGEDFTYSDWWTDQPDCGENKEFYLGTYEGTLINAYRWNDFSNKNNLVGCFVMEKAQLENKSTISAETIKLGETVTANAKATGGTGEYLYQVVYKQTTQSKWTTAQSYKANSTVTFKPANAATYDVCVKVKDSNNTEIKKFFTVKVTSDELKNTSAISAKTINLGSTVTVNAKATGSTEFYTYAVYYKQKAQTKWTTKQDFKANNTVAVKPAKATTYDICVKVKDDKGTIVKKYFTVNVTNFVNTSTLSATEIKLGSTVKVSCSATGSTGYYQYAVYYKKTSDTKWTTKQSYSSNNTVTIKPAKATTYDVCVKVKDNQNNEVKKYFKVTVK